MNDATVFSRMPRPGARFIPNPRWPTTAHPVGSNNPGRCDAKGPGADRDEGDRRSAPRVHPSSPRTEAMPAESSARSRALRLSPLATDVSRLTSQSCASSERPDMKPEGLEAPLPSRAADDVPESSSSLSAARSLARMLSSSSTVSVLRDASRWFPSRPHSRRGAMPKCSSSVGATSTSHGGGRSSPHARPSSLTAPPANPGSAGMSTSTQPVACCGSESKPVTPAERSWRPPPAFQSSASKWPCMVTGMSARVVPPAGDDTTTSQSSLGCAARRARSAAITAAMRLSASSTAARYAVTCGP
mmetsp:Transcript_1244/g.5197  ORF Transcript_1244/g.5197 Transcript_1244/m.5197 type:complete len:302 (-) Transcript_1244:117-1022(-)